MIFRLGKRPIAALAVSKNGLHLAMDEESLANKWGRRMFYALMVLSVGLILTNFWDHLDRRTSVVPYVQTVSVHDDGRMVIMPQPKPLREFVIPPAAIEHLLGRLVVDLRRISKDTLVNEDGRRNVLAALCTQASLPSVMPPQRQAKLVTVRVDAVTPGASPQSWHADWVESWYDTQELPMGEHRFRADITLQRREPDWAQPGELERYRRMPIGLCIQSALVHEVPR
jgi:type IV secretory pathway TrbF-like protein